jgi:hypothetical protein
VTARVARHLRYALDPAGEDEKGQRRHDRRGLRLATTWEGMLDLDGLLDAARRRAVRSAGGGAALAQVTRVVTCLPVW